MMSFDYRASLQNRVQSQTHSIKHSQAQSPVHTSNQVQSADRPIGGISSSYYPGNYILNPNSNFALESNLNYNRSQSLKRAEKISQNHNQNYLQKQIQSQNHSFGYNVATTETGKPHQLQGYKPSCQNSSPEYGNSNQQSSVSHSINYNSQNTLVDSYIRNEFYNSQIYSNESSRSSSSSGSDSDNAIDGALSVTIRPIGYMKHRFGSSVRLLGAGTGGQVNLHHHYSNGRVVAVKSFNKRPSSASSSARVPRPCLAELAISVNVNHINIIQTLEVIMEYDHTYFSVMEHCPTDLFSLLQERKVGRKELNCYFAQLCHGIRYLHSKGIAHRDLKLDNICIAADGTLKIVDFGCATIFRRKIPVLQQQNSSEMQHSYTKHLDQTGIEPVAMSRTSKQSPQVDHFNRNTDFNRYAPNSSGIYSNGQSRFAGFDSNEAQNQAIQNKAGNVNLGSHNINHTHGYNLNEDSLYNRMVIKHQRQSQRQKYAYVDLPSHGLCGSDPYIAPELYICDSYDAKRVDIWAAGIIFLSMTNLHFPWDVANPLKDKNFSTFIRMPRSFIDVWLKNDTAPANLASRMLAVQPSNRISIEMVFQDPWFSSISTCAPSNPKFDHSHHINCTD